MDKFKGLFINGERSGYAPEQCNETFTIDELISQLEGLRENCGGNTKVYLYNDNGYTYGHINENTMDIGNYAEGKGVKFNDDYSYRGCCYY